MRFKKFDWIVIVFACGVLFFWLMRAGDAGESHVTAVLRLAAGVAAFFVFTLPAWNRRSAESRSRWIWARAALAVAAVLTALFLLPALAHASGGAGAGGEDILHVMTRFVLQLGIIGIAARLSGLFMRRVRLPVPPVLAELLIGVAIGPYLLGGVPLPGFPDGIFPLSTASVIPVSPELYGIATIASIIMLFSTGLETDLALLLRFSLAGLAVGVGGVIASFLAGVFAAVFFFNLPFLDPGALFLGVICTATSVGITARILSEKRKIDSPEGVTILAGAVIDDVLGIITLTVVTGLVASSAVGGGAGGAHAGAVWTVAKAVLVWLGFTAAGIMFARPLARGIKKFKSVTFISLFALNLALIVAGIFETAGLAMIIGAYVVGLSLSKTDLNDTVRETLDVMNSFFVPVFFIVMGMLVDLRVLMSREVLVFGAVFSVAAIAAKAAGSGIPTLFLNFNRLGALRIGMAMVPRGEVALIIAGIGLSSGVLPPELFGAGVLMTLVTTATAPLVSMLFNGDKKGTKKDVSVRRTVVTPMDFRSRELTGLLEMRVIQAFRSEGFFAHSIFIGGHNVYHLRKNDAHITLHAGDFGLEFESDANDVMFIKAVVYETLLRLNDVINSVKDIIKPEHMLKELTDTVTIWKADAELKNALSPFAIIPTLRGGRSKQDTVEKLVGILHEHGLVKDTHEAVMAVMEREVSMSTGLQYGIALPHGRTDAVDRITVAVGLSQKGIEWQSLDGEPARIFVLVLSPSSSEGPHIQFLANVSSLLNSAEAREKLLSCRTQDAIYRFFKDGMGGVKA